ncbi:39S ribosomal protein L9, mitochondrial [Trichinella pseudospiralis]|uniref:Large ribosomal subunit protein bL9m n=1 Tax=Trichinella pseudospiralis TaxID=6337 RepID=A0A0V0XRJ0_TRIPS|nr:39S ribosomal protein L9, mitochondrial [Trichinella pseudospiralis]KRY74107.1 39S ribosomal protein L9, mitochondrial [Trichinella pseudospiralis]KRZ22665.1 39S ribosomal protein L9, mitochondrial [Trichinella pseudospiralis]
MRILLRLFDQMSTNFRTFVRRTWIFQHAHYFPVTVAGREQRSPDEKELFQHYEVVQEDGVCSRPDVAVILTQDVEGYGKAGEVITVASEILHNELLPLKLVVYPTKFNRRLYNITDEQMSMRSQKKLSFELRTSKELHSTVVIVNMSLDNEWTMEKWHLRVSMRLQGFMVPDDCIILPLNPIVGPNLDLEAKLFRFYVVVNKHIVVPMIGRIQQVSNKMAKKLIMPGLDPHVASEEELKVCEIVPEQIYNSEVELTLSDEEIFQFMQTYNFTCTFN